jgi:hypothetical protein
VAERCATRWFCTPCGRRHSCALDQLHGREHRNKRVRELDVCQWDGRTALRFPDPAKDDGDTIFAPRKAATR